MRAGHFSRGQALVETAFFVPILLLVLFGVIYFSQLGVISQRMQIAIRYGALVAFNDSSAPAYSAADIYVAANSGSGVCQAPPIGPLYNSSPFPGPTTAPYWQPSAPAPSSSCTLQTINLGGASFLMSRYITQGNVQMSAYAGVPTFLQPLFSGPTAITASEPWVHPAWPGSILTCIAKTRDAVHDALTATETVTLPFGWGWSSTGCP